MSTAPTLTRRNVLSSDDTTMSSRTATRSSSEADYTARRERYEKEVAAVKEAAEERKRRFMAKKIGGYAYGGTLPTGAAEAPEIPEYRQEIAGKATGKGIAPDPFADVLAYLEGEYSRAAAEEATIDIAESRKGYDIQLGNIEAQGAAIRAEEARQQAVARRYGYDSMRELQAATLEFKMGSYMRDIAPTATGGRVLREQWKPFLTDEGYAAAREAQGQARAAEVMENIVPAPMEAAGKLQRMQERMTRGASVADYGRSVQEALTPRVQAARDQVETTGGGIVEAYGDLERGISTKVKEILPDYGAVSPYVEPAIRIGTYMNPIEFFPRVFSGRDPLLEFRLGLAEGTYTGTREKPVTTAAMFALGFVMPAVGKVAGIGWGAVVGTVGKAGPYVTKIPAVGAGLARAGSIGAVAVPKLVSAGIAGLYGAHVFEEYGGTEALNQTARQAGTTTGRLAATEWLPLAAGGYFGIRTTDFLSDRWVTRGLQEIPAEQLMPASVISGQQRFPTVRAGEEPPWKLINRFRLAGTRVGTSSPMGTITPTEMSMWGYNTFPVYRRFATERLVVTDPITGRTLGYSMGTPTSVDVPTGVSTLGRSVTHTHPGFDETLTQDPFAVHFSPQDIWSGFLSGNRAERLITPTRLITWKPPRNPPSPQRVADVLNRASNRAFAMEEQNLPYRVAAREYHMIMDAAIREIGGTVSYRTITPDMSIFGVESWGGFHAAPARIRGTEVLAGDWGEGLHISDSVSPYFLGIGGQPRYTLFDFSMTPAGRPTVMYLHTQGGLGRMPAPYRSRLASIVRRYGSGWQQSAEYRQLITEYQQVAPRGRGFVTPKYEVQWVGATTETEMMVPVGTQLQKGEAIGWFNWGGRRVVIERWDAIGNTPVTPARGTVPDIDAALMQTGYYMPKKRGLISFLPSIPSSLSSSRISSAASSANSSIASFFSSLSKPSRPSRQSSRSRRSSRSESSLSSYLSRVSRASGKSSMSDISRMSSGMSSVISGMSSVPSVPSIPSIPSYRPPSTPPYVPPPVTRKEKQKKEKRRRDIFAIGRYDIAHPVWTPEEVLLGGFEPMPKTGKMFDIEVFEAGRSRRVKRKKRRK